MAVVGDIAAAPPFTVRIDANTVTAAEVMRDKEVGDVMVVDDDGRPIGLLSLEDLAASTYVDDHELRTIFKSIARCVPPPSRSSTGGVPG